MNPSNTHPLWTFKHPYYAQEGNYFSKDCHQTYESFDAFLEAEGDVNIDYNLLYRWDWHRRDIDPEYEDAGDKRDEILFFFIGQRKAIARSVSVRVEPADRDRVEPLMREYLEPRLKRLLELWAPLVKP